MPPERIFIVGGPGSGKTTLASELGRRTALPVHSLDDIARVGGGSGPVRSEEDRRVMLESLMASGRWIAEGVHVGWTASLVDAADEVIWLDHVGSRRSSANILRRFVRQAAHEMRSRRGRDRFLRVRDYARRLGELARALPETRAYERSGRQSTDGSDAPVTRAQIARALERHGAKLRRCRTAADVEDLLRTFPQNAATQAVSSTTSPDPGRAWRPDA